MPDGNHCSCYYRVHSSTFVVPYVPLIIIDFGAIKHWVSLEKHGEAWHILVFFSITHGRQFDIVIIIVIEVAIRTKQSPNESWTIWVLGSFL